MKRLSIGAVKLKNSLFLAPMVEVTDLPYRLVCRKVGAAMVYTEMINIGSILHENEKTKNMLKTCKEDRPSGVQITGPTVEQFKQVTPYLREFDIVDINCGCPSIRITDNASGSYLLKTPNKIASYIKILKNEGYTATAKIRLGFRKNNVMTVAKAIEKAGADALTLHARLSNDSYKVPAQWKWIGEIKRNIGIPVMGNGDVDSGEKAAEMLDICDGVMIARAAMGDPTIFSRVLHYLKTGKEKEMNVRANLQLFIKYLGLAQKYRVVEMPRIKFLGGNFLRGFEGAASARASLMRLNDFESVNDFIKEKIASI